MSLRRILQPGILLMFLAGAMGGCLAAGPILEPKAGTEPANLIDHWRWSVPGTASGTFTIRLDVWPTPDPLRIDVTGEQDSPTKYGEAFYFAGFWENGTSGHVAAGLFVPGIPADANAYANVLGNQVGPAVDGPPLPNLFPASYGQTFSSQVPSSSQPGTPRTLVLAGFVLRDGSLASPQEASLDVQAAGPRLRVREVSFTPGGVGAIFMGKGDLDGPTSVHIHAFTDAGHVAGTTKIRTTNNTVVLGRARLEGDGPFGVGTVSMTLHGARENVHWEIGGLGRGSSFDWDVLRHYGDEWTLDADFLGEGYLFVLFADVANQGPIS